MIPGRSDHPVEAAAYAARRETGWPALTALMLGPLLASVAALCLFPQLVGLSQEFGQPVNRVIWAMVVLDIMGAGVGGVAAALGAVLGNRRMLLVTLTVLLTGCLLAALAPNLAVLIVARALQGVAWASIALSFGIVAAYWQGDRLRQAMSMLVFAMSGGAFLGYLLSGLVWKAGGDWRTVFWVVCGATAADLVLTALVVKETERVAGSRVDYLGCLGLVSWAVLLLLPLSQANSWGWGSARTLGILLPGLAVLGLWIAWELRFTAPLIDLRLLKRMAVWQGFVVWLVVTLLLYIPFTTTPYLFQTPAGTRFGLGRSIFAVSVALAVASGVSMVLAPATTPLMRRLGAKRTLLLGMAFGLGGFGMAFAHGSVWTNVLWLAVIGVSAAWAGSACFALAAEAVPPHQGIMVGTLYNTAAGIGAAVSPALAGYVLSLRQVAVTGGPAGTPVLFPAEETFVWSSLIVGAVSIVGMLCVLSIRTKQLKVVGREPDTRADR